MPKSAANKSQQKPDLNLTEQGSKQDWDWWVSIHRDVVRLRNGGPQNIRTQEVWALSVRSTTRHSRLSIYPSKPPSTNQSHQQMKVSHQAILLSSKLPLTIQEKHCQKQASPAKKGLCKVGTLNVFILVRPGNGLSGSFAFAWLQAEQARTKNGPRGLQ